MQNLKGLTNQQKESYENTSCFNLQSCARECGTGTAKTRKEITTKEAGANCPATSSAHSAADRRWQKTAGGDVSRAENAARPNLSGSSPSAKKQESPNIDARLPGQEPQSTWDFNHCSGKPEG